jgi:hypothetical protein
MAEHRIATRCAQIDCGTLKQDLHERRVGPRRPISCAAAPATCGAAALVPPEKA